MALVGPPLETIQKASKLPLIFFWGKRVSLRKSLSISLSQTITETSRIRLEKGDQIGNSPTPMTLLYTHLNEIFKKGVLRCQITSLQSDCLKRAITLIRRLQKLARQTKLVLLRPNHEKKNLGFMQ